MSTQLKGEILVPPQEVLIESSTQLVDLGAKAITGDRRIFRYAKIGGLATVAGKLYQGAAQDTTNMNPTAGIAPSANVALGATSFAVSTSLTLAANVLAGSYMSVVVTPGAGYYYKVKGNTAVSGATGMTVYLEDPIQVALTSASSKVCFMQNPYNSIVVAPTTMTNMIVGVAQSVFTASYFAWIQTGGQASCLQTGTGTCGTALGFLQGGTEGSLAPAIAGTPILAYALGTSTTGQYSHVFLTID